MKCRAQTHFPRGLRFPVPLYKGNGGSGNEIGASQTSRHSAHAQSQVWQIEDKSDWLRGQNELSAHVSKIGPVTTPGARFSRTPETFRAWKAIFNSLYLATERCIHLNPCSYKTMRIKQFWNHKVWDFPMAFRVWNPFRDPRETGPWPEVAILGAELNERGLWGRENNDARLILHRKLNGTTTW